MYKIKFEANPRPNLDWHCPICSSTSSTVEVIVDTGNPLVGTQELARCHRCESRFFLGDDPVLGYQHAGFDDRYWMHYVQVGAGIDAMLRPLMALGRDLTGELLDVGCGFGFIPDYWTRSGRGRGIGLETASYGKVGRELLGAELYPQLLADCQAIRGRLFDVVYSSEVIEHVRDPKGFLAQLSEVLAPSGILVLTTPSAACVREDFDLAALHAALSPGFHYFLLSKTAFDGLLDAAGFRYRRVLDTGDRLIAWASRVEFGEPDLERFDWDGYLDYLALVSQCANPHLRGGALYRLFKDSLNTGRHDRVPAAFTQLEDVAKTTYGIDFMFPAVAQALETRDFLGYLDRYPAWLGGALLFAGIYAGNALGDVRRKMRLLEASTHVLRHSMEIGFQFAQEAAAFLPVATFNFRIALAEALESELPKGLGIDAGDAVGLPSRNQIRVFRDKLSAVLRRIPHGDPGPNLAQPAVSKGRDGIKKRRWWTKRK